MKTSLLITFVILLAPISSSIAAPPVQTEEADHVASAPDDQKITFDSYREWRLNFIERRRNELATQLSATDLPAARKARLQQVKEYYDWFANLPAADRDHRFRERFDRIDANHDGEIDPAERAAWRDKQRALYHRYSDRSQTAATK